MSWAIVIAGGTALVGAGANYLGSQKAAKTAAKGADVASAEAGRQFDIVRGDNLGRINIGNQAFNALGGIYGYSPQAQFNGGSGQSGTAFSAPLPQASVPGGSFNIGGQLTQKLGGIGKILDPAASIFGSKHGDERRNLSAFMADNQLTDLGNGMVGLPDGRTFPKDQLQSVAGAYYGSRYHPDGNQSDWQSKYNGLLSAPQGQNGLTSDGVPQGFGPLQGGAPGMSQPMTAPDYSNFYKSPDYQFRKDQGMEGIGNAFSASGGVKSGNALKALAEFNSNLAAGGFNDYFNHQASIAGLGQVASGQSAAAGINTGQTVGNALQNSADARASGVAGGYNALGQGLSGLTQGLGYYLANRRQQIPNYGGGGFGPANVYGG